MSVLCPFSAGFIYNRTNELRGLLTRAGGESCKQPWGDPLAHHSYFGSLYRHSDFPFFSEPLESWDKLIDDPRPVFDTTVVPPLQPTWNPADPFSEVTISRREQCGDSRKTTRVELLAWYAPAHTNVQNEYGIHLTQVGVVKTAASIQQLLSRGGTIFSRRSAVIIASYILYCHELAHALIEDLASVLEFSAGASRYTLCQRAFGHYALMEEAFCNTFAYSCLIQFIDSTAGARLEEPRKLEHYREFEGRHGKNYIGKRPYVAEPEPTFKAAALLDSVEEWMRSQPPGYSEFLADRIAPPHNGLLWLNLARILSDLYGFTPYHVAGAMEVMGVHGDGPLSMLLERHDKRNAEELLKQIRAEHAPEGYGWPIHVSR